MAKEQDVADIINLYNDFFNNSVDDDDADPIIDAKPPLSIPFGDLGGSEPCRRQGERQGLVKILRVGESS